MEVLIINSLNNIDMEGNCIYNRANAANSLQISIMGNIIGANFSIPDGRGGKEPFLLKNVTEENITVSVILYGMEDPIETIVFPGWNVELVKEVVTTVEGLQYGY